METIYKHVSMVQVFKIIRNIAPGKLCIEV